MTENKPYKSTIEQKEDALVEIKVSVSWDEVEKHRKAVVEHFANNLTIDGFRKGHIPENIVKQNVGESTILSEMAERTLKAIYPQVIMENEIQVLSSPQIQITKLAEGNQFEFTATAPTLPEVTLADYKKIAKEVYSQEEDLSVTDQEVEDAIKHIQQQWTRSEKMQKLANEEGKKVGEIDPRTIEIKDEELPELTDDFVKNVGPFETVEEFKTKLKENIGEEKRLRNIDKKRAEVLNKISEKTEVKLPEILVESELHRMLGQFKGDVERAGMQLDKYLEETKKTEDDLKKSWRPDAEKYAKNQLLMNEIARAEGLSADKEEVDKEVDAILAHYKDADKHSARVYIETVLTNKLVFEFLEKQK